MNQTCSACCAQANERHAVIKNGHWLALLLLALVGCSGGGTDSNSSTPEPVSTSGMENTARAGDLLFGGQPSREALRELKAQGYKTVLSTRGHDELAWDEEALADSLGLRFVSIPMDKPVTLITDDQLNRFADLMKTGERPMILHCSSGNRVAGLWTVWLAEHEGMLPEEALRLGDKAGMTRIRPLVEERLGKSKEK